MTPAPSDTQRISEITRRGIFDSITLQGLSWHGRMQDDDFLARLYNLKKLRSTDHRFTDAAGDIWQHRVRNSDWDWTWVFTDSRFNLIHCPDEVFLRFLCETIHPVVQPDENVVSQLLEIFNSHLVHDGLKIVETTRISGKPTFAATDAAVEQPALAAARKLADTVTTDYLNQQITRMTAAVHGDPALAIGTAKELIETVCKTILRERGKEPDENWDVPKLVRMTFESLRLATDQIPRHLEAADSIRRTVGNLAQVASGVAELRNLYGTGHGKDADEATPPPHHARLAVSAASTLVVFLFETHQADPVS